MGGSATIYSWAHLRGQSFLHVRYGPLASPPAWLEQLAADATEHLPVQPPEARGHDVTNVRQTQQRQRDAQHGVRDGCQATVVGLGRHVTVP
jgi:hypothetical protein